jgi:hypothetical protein
MNTVAPSQSASRDDIMKEIANQAATVRRTFEAHQSKRKNTVSSATAAAAHHMASLNRKRKFENSLVIRANSVAVNVDRKGVVVPPDHNVWNRTSRTFHSPIASFTRPEKKRTVSVGSSSNSSTHREAAPRVSDGIVLRATPRDITVSYNDVVCGKGKTTSTLVGNQRYQVWVDLHKEAFAKALYPEGRQKIARSIVNAVSTSVPQGRFLSLEVQTGLWYDVGYERAMGITLETLMNEAGMVRNHGMVAKCHGMRQPTVQRAFASRAA